MSSNSINKFLDGLVIAEKVYYACMLLVAISIPFSVQLNSGLIILTFCASLFCYVKRNNRQLRLGKYALLFVGLYFINFIGFLNSENTKPVIFDVQQKLSLLILPLIYILGPTLDRRMTRILQAAFMMATLFVCLYGFRNGFYLGYYSEKLYGNLLINHPYLGMYCVFSVLFGVDILSSPTKPGWRAFYLGLIVIFIFYLLVLFAKMSIVVFFFLTACYTLWKLYKNGLYRWILVSVMGAVLFLGYFGLINPKGKGIIKEILSFKQFDWENYDPVIVNSLNMRFIKWTCSTEVLERDDNWLFGAGTGDSQELLNACYTEKVSHDSFFVVLNYNSHNEYFTLWLNLGIVALLFFIFHFYVLLRRYVIVTDLIGLLFTIGMILFCTTESMLETQKGIVFYSFFQSMFLFTERGRMPNNSTP